METRGGSEKAAGAGRPLEIASILTGQGPWGSLSMLGHFLLLSVSQTGSFTNDRGFCSSVL